MNTTNMTLAQIHDAGIKALARELGPVGMVRFLQQYETGQGDYTDTRAQWLAEPKEDDLLTDHSSNAYVNSPTSLDDMSSKQ